MKHGFFDTKSYFETTFFMVNLSYELMKRRNTRCCRLRSVMIASMNFLTSHN